MQTRSNKRLSNKKCYYLSVTPCRYLLTLSMMTSNLLSVAIHLKRLMNRNDDFKTKYQSCKIIEFFDPIVISNKTLWNLHLVQIIDKSFELFFKFAFILLLIHEVNYHLFAIKCHLFMKMSSRNSSVILCKKK